MVCAMAMEFTTTVTLQFIQENLEKICGMEKVQCNMEANTSMRDFGKMILGKVTGSISIQMEHTMKECLKMEKEMDKALFISTSRSMLKVCGVIIN